MQSLRGITQLSLILISFVAKLAFPTSKIFETRCKVFFETTELNLCRAAILNLIHVQQPCLRKTVEKGTVS